MCTIGLNLFRQLAVYLAPVLPEMAQQTGELLGDRSPLGAVPGAAGGHAGGRFQHLMQRVDRKRVDAMLAASAEPDRPRSGSRRGRIARATTTPRSRPSRWPRKSPSTTSPRWTCGSAASWPPKRCRRPRNLKLTLSLGGDHRRTVFAGIKGYYKPEELVGRLLLCVANLAPRKMKFGLSEGMILAAGSEGEVHLLLPDEGASGAAGALALPTRGFLLGVMIMPSRRRRCWRALLRAPIAYPSQLPRVLPVLSMLLNLCM